MKNNVIVLAIASLVAIVLVYASSYVVPEGRQVVITQFGKPVKSVNDAGLHFKLPFIQEVRMIDLRILTWDGFPNQIPTKDKKYIEVDTTARWKIIDPLKLIQTVQSQSGAKSRLDAILDGITRDVVSSNNLVEAVRNSNNILDRIEEMKRELEESRKNSNIDEQDEITGEIEKVSIGREQLSQQIVTKAREELLPLGIELIDVQLKRISYEASVERKVYDRMISERERVAEKIRSYGKGEQAKIQGKTEKELKTIESGAYKKVQIIKGKAESEAINIYAASLSRNPGFYRFVRSLEAYEQSIPEDAKLLLSSESKFFKVLTSGKSN
ncbi:MAG: protease modulator HflC [Bdellovibrionales bacterium]